MIEKLLFLTKEIINLCNLILEEKNSPNVDVIKIIKNEFEQQYNSICHEKKVIVLNNKRDIWAARTITDSANIEFDNVLFKMVFNFAELCRQVSFKDLIILYD